MSRCTWQNEELPSGLCLNNMVALDTTEYTLRSLARWLAVSAVILSAWLFGSAEAWAYLVVCQISAVAVILWLMSLMAGSRQGIVAPGLTTVLILLAVFVCLQMVPIPRTAVEALNPFSAQVGAKTQSVLLAIGSHAGTIAERSAAVASSWTLSVCPAETMSSLFLLIAYIGVFLVLANSIRIWEQLRNVSIALVVSGFLMSLVGVIHKFSGSSEMLWFHEPRYGGDIFGPFTNPNHFAAHVNMLLGVALGLYLSTSRMGDNMASSNWSDRIARYSTRRASGAALAIFAVTLMGGAVCMSLSRGGITSLVAGAGIVFLAITFFSSKGGKVRFRLIAVGILIVAAVIWLGWRPVIEELFTLGMVASHPADDARFIATCDTLKVFGICPVFGSGFGSFRYVFPVFQSEVLHFGRWLHAHNDWAQLLAEGGIIGATLAFLAISQWIRFVMRRLSGAGTRSRLMVIGLMVGITAVAVHSFWDYSLHKPCNMLLLASIAGLAIAAVGMERTRGEFTDQGGQAGAVERSESFVSQFHLRCMALFSVGGLVLIMMFQSSEIRSELSFSRFLYLERLAKKTSNVSVLQRTIAQSVVEVDRAMPLAHSNPDAVREMTAALFTWMMDGRCDYDLRMQLAGKASKCAQAAVISAPSDYLSWLWMARIQASQDKWMEADLCLENARNLVIPGHAVRLFLQPGQVR